MNNRRGSGSPLVVTILLFCLSLIAPIAAFASFGLTTTTDLYTVDTGAGLVFSVRRTDPSNNTQSAGDISSLKFNGVEYQDQTKGSQINSGLGAATVTATTYGTSYIKIQVTSTDGTLIHYYMARSGYPHVYMATYFTQEPSDGLVRYIARLNASLLPNSPAPSNLTGNTGAIESSDIFGMPDGTTRSKHYSNHRLIDWSSVGETGTNVGAWIVRDGNEGGSGGPFYRCLLNQNAELYEIVNYGEAQTEAFRTSVLNGVYALVFTTGAAPSALDTSWVSGLGLTGYVGASGRGRVTGVGIAGRDTNYRYVVGFANGTAQYWTVARASDGYFDCPGMIPGTYTMTVYKNELAVWTGSAQVTAGSINALHTITVTGDPSTQSVLWRIGDWDGTPSEFLNGDKITYMHPSDSRIATWNPGTYVVGSSSPASGFPCYQWNGVNGTETIQFSLTSAQVAAHTVRIGITTAYANARPRITVNSWTSAIPVISTQPSTRTLTIGTYRGNNFTYSFSVPASAFVAGTNTLTITPVSGSGGTGYLSAGYSFDCVDLY